MKALESRHVVVGFKATADLVARADAAADREGITRSDIARRALIRDLERKAQETAA